MKAWIIAPICSAFLCIVVAKPYTSLCRREVKCPCGQSGTTVTLCLNDGPEDEFCNRLQGCKTCQDGIPDCLDCPDGFEGLWCTRITHKVLREKRQIRSFSRTLSSRRSASARISAYTFNEFCDFLGCISNGREIVRLPEDGEASGIEEYPEGTRIRYRCDAGYTLEGNPELVCEEGGFWSSEKPVCKKVFSTASCEDPGFIRSGRRWIDGSESTSPRSFLHGESVSYECIESGIQPRATFTRTCRNGQWSGEMPSCGDTADSPLRERVFCDSPGALLDGTFTAAIPDTRSRRSSGQYETEFPEGTRLIYHCEDDYILIGAPVLTCRSTGSWSSTPPFCSAECGRSFVESSVGRAHQRVLHGTTTQPGEWPWTVAIGLRRGNFTQIECGGSLLDSQTVVTAAHCLVGNSFTLYFGKIHRSISKDDTEVLVRQSTRWIRHPDFNNSTLDSDIGLIMFAPRIRYTDRVQPICLPSQQTAARNLMTGRTGYVTGWGVTENHLASDELRMAQLPVLTANECRDSYRSLGSDLLITQNMFCAGFRDAQQAVCSGDSGSPLVFRDAMSDTYTLEGLVSFGVQGQCGQPGRYTLFTKVNPFVPWLLRNLS